MRKLNHSNIVKLEGVYETENSIYVTLEYLEGEQLNELIKVISMLYRVIEKYKKTRSKK